MGSDSGLNISTSGTATAPVTYLLNDGYVLSSMAADGFAYLNVGENGSYNTFLITEGASLFYCFNLRVGNGVNSSHNTLIVSDTAIGEGSDGGAATGNGYDYIGGKWIYIGQDGASYNTLIVRDGARFLSGSLYIFGYQNSVIVSGAGSAMKIDDVTGKDILMTGSYGNVIVSDGASLYTGGAINTGYSADSDSPSHNSVTISGNSTVTSSGLIINNTGSLLVSGQSSITMDTLSVTNGSTALITEQSVITTFSASAAGISISAGSQLTVNSASQVTVGAGIDVSNSTLLVTGSGTSVKGGTATANVITGSKFIVSNGATVSFSPTTLTVNRSTLSVSGAATTLMVSASSVTLSTSQFLVSEGATARFTSAYMTATNSSFDVSGEGSNLLTYRISIYSASTITMEEGGLLTLSRTTASSLSVESGSFLRLCDGYLAWKGNHVNDLKTLISNGRFQLLDLNGNWVTITDFTKYTITYADAGIYSNTDSLTNNLYDDLTGYTILTAAAIVPEPTTHVLLVSSGIVLALTAWRRQTTRHANSLKLETGVTS
jgi:hypothetical protein